MFIIIIIMNVVFNKARYYIVLPFQRRQATGETNMVLGLLTSAHVL